MTDDITTVPKVIADDELMYALEESVKLQSHYASLLNMYDNGQRRQFKNAIEWLQRLRESYLNARNIYEKKRI